MPYFYKWPSPFSFTEGNQALEFQRITDLNNEISIKLPFNSETLYTTLSRSIKISLWFTYPLVLAIGVSAMLRETASTKTLDMSDIYIFLQVVIFIGLIFLFIHFLVNRLFNEYFLLKDGVLVHQGPSIERRPQRHYQLKDIKIILWETEKLPLYGSRNSLFLVDESSNKHVIFEKQFAFSIYRQFDRFLIRLKTLMDIPIEKEFYVLSPDLKKRYDINKSAFGIDGEQELRKYSLIKNIKLFYVVSFAIPFSCAAAYRFFPAQSRFFILFGLISAVTPILYFYYLGLRYRDKSDLYEHPFMIIIGGLTLAIPYSIFYTLFVMIMGGFKFPFDF